MKYAVKIAERIVHLLPTATESDARTIAQALKSQAYRVTERLVERDVWVGPHRLDTEVAWVSEYSYDAL